MSFLLSSAAKARHEYFDRTMSEATTMLLDPAVMATLGQTSTDSYRLLLDCYYVPDVKHDVVQLPETDPRTRKGIPVLPLAIGESFEMPARIRNFHPFQLAEMGNRLLEWGFSESGANSLRRKIAYSSLQHPLKSTLENGYLGAVCCVASTQIISNPLWDSPELIQIFGAPHVELNMNSEEGELEDALTLVHESKHVLQHMEEPIVRDYQDYDGQYADIKEHEAIELEETVKRALIESSGNPKYKSWAPLEVTQQV